MPILVNFRKKGRTEGSPLLVSRRNKKGEKGIKKRAGFCDGFSVFSLRRIVDFSLKLYFLLLGFLRMAGELSSNS